ncbi:MAG: hypothetical protein ABIO65_11245 [Nitrospiria bacterium]
MAGRPWIPVQGRAPADLGGDERGSLMVLEAILVAMLVLTAILFFTSVQRPSTGSDQGGLDLGQVAADTLSILEVRTIEGQSFEGWVTNTTRGDNATATAVRDFLEEVLPTGTRFAIRLDNGVSNLTILSSGTVTTPHAARGAQIFVFPNWATYRNQTIGAGLTVTPGEVVASTHALVSGTYHCFQAPNGFSTAPDGPDAGATADLWEARWNTDPGILAPWKADAQTLGSNEQIPRDLPLGRWKVSTGVAVSGQCSAGTITHVNVVPPGSRTIDVTTTAGSTTFTVNSGLVTSADVGKTLVGSNVNATARVVSLTTMNKNALATGPTTLTLSPDSTFMPYGLQLVVWFGA